MWSCMAETVCAWNNEWLWTPLLCAQMMWTCDERNSHAFDSYKLHSWSTPSWALQYHWWNYSNYITSMLLKTIYKNTFSLCSQYKSESVMRCGKSLSEWDVTKFDTVSFRLGKRALNPEEAKCHSALWVATCIVIPPPAVLDCHSRTVLCHTQR